MTDDLTLELSTLTPVANDTRKSAAMASVRRAVMAGELRPGQRIKEVQLAEALGISRPTLREALQQLVHEGILTVEPYKGVRIAKPSAQELIDATRVRISLETQAALELAARPDGAAIAALRDALAQHVAALDAGNPEASDRTHLQLHHELWHGSGNSMLMRIWPLVESQIQLTMMLDEATRNDTGRDRAMHIRLVDAIASGQPERIVAEVNAHISWSDDDWGDQ